MEPSKVKEPFRARGRVVGVELVLAQGSADFEGMSADCLGNGAERRVGVGDVDLVRVRVGTDVAKTKILLELSESH